jgi:hypothetical protein
MTPAHIIDDKTEAAYRQGDLFGKRRRPMDAWATHLVAEPAARTVVLPIKAASGTHS